MHKCTYPTDELCKELSKSLETVEHLIYATIDEHNKLYEDKKDSLTTNNRLTDSAKGDLVCSLLPQKYIQIIEVYALKM